MEHGWKRLLTVTSGKKFTITKIHIPEDDISIEGSFQVPPFAELSMEDQLFIAAFIKTHGSIKQMESIFNISYPTVKNRLNQIASRLDLVDVSIKVANPVSSILDRLERGDITALEAIEEMR